MSAETAFVILAALGAANLAATLIGVIFIVKVMRADHDDMMSVIHIEQERLQDAIKGAGK